MSIAPAKHRKEEAGANPGQGRDRTCKAHYHEAARACKLENGHVAKGAHGRALGHLLLDLSFSTLPAIPQESPENGSREDIYSSASESHCREALQQQFLPIRRADRLQGVRRNAPQYRLAS